MEQRSPEQERRNLHVLVVGGGISGIEEKRRADDKLPEIRIYGSAQELELVRKSLYSRRSSPDSSVGAVPYSAQQRGEKGPNTGGFVHSDENGSSYLVYREIDQFYKVVLSEGFKKRAEKNSNGSPILATLCNYASDPDKVEGELKRIGVEEKKKKQEKTGVFLSIMADPNLSSVVPLGTLARRYLHAAQLSTDPKETISKETIRAIRDSVFEETKAYLSEILEAPDWNDWPLIMQKVVLFFRQLFLSTHTLNAMRNLKARDVFEGKPPKAALLGGKSQVDVNANQKPLEQISLTIGDKVQFNPVFPPTKPVKKDAIELIKSGKAVLKAFGDTDGFNHIIETIKNPIGKGKEKNPHARQKYSKKYVVEVDRKRKAWKVVEENKASHSGDAKSTSFSLIPKTGLTRTFNQRTGDYPIAVILDFDNCRKAKYAFHGKNAFTNEKWWRLNERGGLDLGQTDRIEQFIASGFDTFEEYSDYVNRGQISELPEAYLHPSLGNSETIAVAIVNPDLFRNGDNRLWAIYEKIQIEEKLGVSNVQIILLNDANNGASEYTIEEQMKDVERYFDDLNNDPSTDKSFKGKIQLPVSRLNSEECFVEQKYFREYFEKNCGKSSGPSL